MAKTENQVEERCFFCGEMFLVSKKAMGEHYISQWLIAMTGDDKNRKAIMPKSDFETTMQQFPKCHIPAHPHCNNAWKNIEANAKITMCKILKSEGTASAIELVNLLNWFDKVRWGCFWHSKMANPEKAFMGIKPKMGANERAGLHDRILVISNASPNHKGVSTFGINSPIFMNQPSVLSLFINGYYFTTISDMGILARDLGIPYPIYGEQNRPPEIEFPEDVFQPIDASFLAQTDPDAFVIAQPRPIPTAYQGSLYGASNKRNHFNSLACDPSYDEVMIWNGEQLEDHIFSHKRLVALDQIRKSNHARKYPHDLFKSTYDLQLKYLTPGYSTELFEIYQQWGKKILEGVQSDGSVIYRDE